MKIIFLTNNDNTHSLYNWLDKQIDTQYITLWSRKISLGLLKRYDFNFLISYNYKYIIPDKILKLFKGKAINLHISYLPWNRGASPNFWSFEENTPKGVTIHKLNKGLDKGDILIQKRVYFKEDIGLKKSYKILHKEIQELFKKHWKGIKNGTLKPKKQKGKGSYHSIADKKNYEIELQYRGSSVES